MRRLRCSRSVRPLALSTPQHPPGSACQLHGSARAYVRQQATRAMPGLLALFVDLPTGHPPLCEGPAGPRPPVPLGPADPLACHGPRACSCSRPLPRVEVGARTSQLESRRPSSGACCREPEEPPGTRLEHALPGCQCPSAPGPGPAGQGPVADGTGPMENTGGSRPPSRRGLTQRHPQSRAARSTGGSRPRSPRHGGSRGAPDRDSSRRAAARPGGAGSRPVEAGGPGRGETPC
jgi:hypothetical protein